MRLERSLFPIRGGGAIPPSDAIGYVYDGKTVLRYVVHDVEEARYPRVDDSHGKGRHGHG